MTRERIKAGIEMGAWLAFAGFLFYFSLGFRNIRYRGGYELGAAFWVDLVVGIIVVCAIANFAIRMIALRRVENEVPADEADAKASPPAPVFQLAVVFALPLLFVWSMPRFGFYLTLPLFVLGVLLALGERRPVFLGAITAAVCGVLFFVFTTLLYVPLPAGNIEMFHDLNIAIRLFLR